MARVSRSTTHEHCDFEGTFRLLGQKHALRILRVLFERSPRRFSELRGEVGVNTATLTDRLKAMQQLGLLQRKVIHVIPRRVEYGLTPMGRDLLQIFRPLASWRTKYSP